MATIWEKIGQFQFEKAPTWADRCDFTKMIGNQWPRLPVFFIIRWFCGLISGILGCCWWNNGRRAATKASEGQRFDNDCDYQNFLQVFIDHFLIGGVRRHVRHHDTRWAFCQSRNGLKVADIFIHFSLAVNQRMNLKL